MKHWTASPNCCNHRFSSPEYMSYRRHTPTMMMIIVKISVNEQWHFICLMSSPRALSIAYFFLNCCHFCLFFLATTASLVQKNCGLCGQHIAIFVFSLLNLCLFVCFFWPLWPLWAVHCHLWSLSFLFLLSGHYGLCEIKSVEWVKYSMSPLSPLCLWQCLFVLSGHYGLCGQQMGASASSLKPPIWPPTIPLFRDLTIIYNMIKGQLLIVLSDQFNT